ncbi:similar to Saccharomyces cerevisiae YCR079W PTC6 Mitochondrial type 2C protein phosphatase (PP2C) with similarity to mammalian PP1Ks [Maudiozyma barnettii]|uniref:Similar to Saccharomyces cerevisiae YCR079W PTC6 Mitochondrial type 2C protein phosphatase (PP2C) with similarity to mammalian PP1Ks n=1 Tax=Maudiozyma barnettii TaxID=61262 RepID=A0A8H2ZHR5_9SACH|nr:type 2C protein phosphatase PTC6 [Kazachstania barnettii]CAB4254777.1 similar to Saccharomyces cerevisiae YCR079W PTC6 Mitochondrial type 2C protein phosphatase (PP2C) with similarity to mammalian PP1Ks [Kazachstania barnettii]CAD1782917.1 similar to Saccharomyces cerevisiae YCR079W PTC6 Mitochondrial type 2C protein phosphatase (PP2C) with similarity to mammalian PP1Ks [Kazachstania barnettii]
MNNAQAFIHVRPAGGGVAGAGLGKSLLRVPLSKFAGLIGHSSSRVSRRINQDTYSMSLVRNSVFSREPLLNMSVFDGHGVAASNVSSKLAHNLHNWLGQEEPRGSLDSHILFRLLRRYRDLFGGSYWQSLYADREKYYDRFIRHCNTKQEQVLFDQSNQGTRMLFDHSGNLIDKNSLLNEQQRLKIINTFLQFDLEQCCGVNPEQASLDLSSWSDKFPGGSTASSIMLSRFDPLGSTIPASLSNDQTYFVSPTGLLKLIVTQVGDSKILICDSNGVAHSLSRPHHPDQNREHQRLHTQNSQLISRDSFGEERFLNNFANTRSFGDVIGKRDGISAEPDIYSYLIGNTSQLPHSEKAKLQFGGDECFIVMVTDGVSDWLSDQELVDLITSTVNLRGLKHATPQFVADEVIKFIVSVADRHADNATCLVLRLSNWGNWPTYDRTGASREQKLLNAI